MLSRFARLVAYVGHARTRYLLVACGLFLGLVLASGAAWLILDLRRAALVDAERDLKNLSFVLSAEVAHDLQTLELVEEALIEQMRQTGIDTPEEFERDMASWEVHQNLQDRVTAIAPVADLSLFDDRGRLVNLTAAWPVPADSIANRDYFGVMAGWPPPTLLISGPVINRATGQWSIVVARRFTSPGGRLLGIVARSIESSYFEQLFSRLSVTSRGSFTLFSGNGALLARHPHREANMGHSIARTASWPRILAALDHAVFIEPGVFDGKNRLVAPHSVGQYRLIVAATNTVDAALAGWREQARTFAGAVGLIELIIAGLVFLGIRHVHGYQALAEADAAQAVAEAARARAECELAVAQEREHSAQALRIQWQHFDMALSNMHQGLCMYDQCSRVLVVNRRFTELFDLSQGSTTAGMDYLELTERVIAGGLVAADDMKEMRDRRQELLSRHECAMFNWELANGKTITVTHQPMQDGWLSTYEDITDGARPSSRGAAARSPCSASISTSSRR